MNSYSITAEESQQIQKEYEITEMLVGLHKAYLEVGDIKISEAIAQLEKKTRFNQYNPNPYLKLYE